MFDHHNKMHNNKYDIASSSLNSDQRTYFRKIFEGTTWLQTVLIHSPILQILLEHQGAATLYHVELVISDKIVEVSLVC